MGRMKKTLLFFSLFLSLSLADVDCQSNPTEDAKYLNGFCGFDVDVSSRLQRVRGIDIAPNNDIIVVDTTSGSIYAYWEETEGFQRATLYSGSIGMNHAVRYHDGYVWASSDTTVYRWRYNFRANLGSPQTVIRDMPQAGAHNTRSMEFDSQNRIYVNIGSGTNIDDTPIRSRIIRADYTGTLPINYADTEVFANGTRNECGLRVNPITGDLWGAENALEFADDDPRDTNNPADEINIFTEANKGRFYGYPYCYSEGYFANGAGALPTGSMGGGSQHAVNPASGLDDAWCRDPNNVISTSFPVRAHEAPLDLIFYQGTTFQTVPGVFPCTNL
jgi:glucose/arabinose dehydrogenase